MLAAFREEASVVTLTPFDTYELKSDSDSIRLSLASTSSSSLDGIVIWYGHLTVPTDREIVCGALKCPLYIVNTSSNARTFSINYKYNKWSSQQILDLNLHDGIYYRDGYIEDFLY